MSTYYIVRERDDPREDHFVHADPNNREEIEDLVEVVNLDGMHSEDAFFLGFSLARKSTYLSFFDTLSDAADHITSLIKGNRNDVVQ